jgi:hypothetical protein
VDRQENIDAFYFRHGPCCAGCDWWRSINSSAGDCTKSAPVDGHSRFAMLGIEGATLPLNAGHLLTRRDHHCGDFKDTFDWSSLALAYRKRVGDPTAESSI